MNKVEKLIAKVSIARKKYLSQVSKFSEKQGQWKPSDKEWNMIEITEHLFLAEQGGIFGMWKTLNAIHEGKMERKFDSAYKDMPIEQIIDLTWQEKEQVPAVAAPRLGGSLAFWCASLNSLQQVLESLGNIMEENDLRVLAHPHPISGDMDFQQRLEFLRFHLDRHTKQVARIITEMGQTG